MKILAIIFLSFGILLILFGISIFTPFLSWAGKRFNSSNSNFVNYKQPSSIRLTSMFMGICLFLFGLFITIASAALLNAWNTPQANPSSIKSVPQTTLKKPETFPSPIVPQREAPISKRENNSFVAEYGLDCPQDAAGLNMRKQASLNSQVITLIPCDAIAIKDRKQRYYQDGVEWYLVEYQENIGWVAGKYLKQQANNQPKTTTFSISKLFVKKRP
ncbi:MAG: SH3 domain-containing protein [Cyanobacteriota bacterium]|nr:SH3 domain-containing protein [Cyanobacteriota bacterium]